MPKQSRPHPPITRQQRRTAFEPLMGGDHHDFRGNLAYHQQQQQQQKQKQKPPPSAYSSSSSIGEEGENTDSASRCSASCVHGELQHLIREKRESLPLIAALCNDATLDSRPGGKDCSCGCPVHHSKQEQQQEQQLQRESQSPLTQQQQVSQRNKERGEEDVVVKDDDEEDDDDDDDDEGEEEEEESTDATPTLSRRHSFGAGNHHPPPSYGAATSQKQQSNQQPQQPQRLPQQQQQPQPQQQQQQPARHPRLRDLGSPSASPLILHQSTNCGLGQFPAISQPILSTLGADEADSRLGDAHYGVVPSHPPPPYPFPASADAASRPFSWHFDNKNIINNNNNESTEESMLSLERLLEAQQRKDLTRPPPPYGYPLAAAPTDATAALDTPVVFAGPLVSSLSASCAELPPPLPVSPPPPLPPASTVA